MSSFISILWYVISICDTRRCITHQGFILVFWGLVEKLNLSLRRALRVEACDVLDVVEAGSM